MKGLFVRWCIRSALQLAIFTFTETALANDVYPVVTEAEEANVSEVYTGQPESPYYEIEFTQESYYNHANGIASYEADQSY